MSNYSTYKGSNPVTLDIAKRDGTGSALLPYGTTAERPASPVEGYIRYNTTLHNYEQYTNQGWVSVAAPPAITSVASATILASSDPQTITINGSNFDAGASVTVLGANLTTTYTPATVSIISGSQIQITFTGAGGLLTGAGSTSGGGEPYSVKVTNATGLATTLQSAFNINDLPTWSTTAGSLGTVYDGTAISTVTLSATDPEGSGLTYAVSSGALPGGLSLSTAGAITGTPSGGSYNSSGVTYNFTVGASDGSNNPTRAFSILKKWYDGSNSTQFAPTAAAIKSLTGTTTDGFYWIKTTGMASPVQVWCDMNTGGGGWMRFWWYGKYEITGSDPSAGDWTVDRDLFSGTLESTFAYDSIRGFNHVPTGYSISGFMVKGNSAVQTKNGSALRYAIYNTTLTGNSTRNAVLDAIQNQTTYSASTRDVWAPTADGTTGGSASGYNNLLSGNYYNNGGPDWFGYSTGGSGVGSSSTSPYKSFNLDDDGGYGNQSWAAGNDSNGTPGVDFFSNDENASRTQNLVMYFK